MMDKSERRVYNWSMDMLIKYLKLLSSHLLIVLILKWTFWLDDVT